MDVFVETSIIDRVILPPSLMNKSFRNNILEILKNKYEGRCSQYGFIVKDSIKINKIGAGIVQLNHLDGSTLFNIEFTSNVCDPIKGTIIRSVVKNMNRFGILCIVKTGENIVLEIIVTKNNSEIKSEINIDEVKIGDEVFVEILGTKYDLNDKKISAIGKIVTNVPENKVIERVKQLNSNEEVVDDYEETLINSDIDDDIDDISEIEEEDDDDDDDEEEEDDDDEEEDDDDDEEEEEEEEEEKEAVVENNDYSDEEYLSDASTVSSKYD